LELTPAAQKLPDGKIAAAIQNAFVAYEDLTRANELPNKAKHHKCQDEARQSWNRALHILKSHAFESSLLHDLMFAGKNVREFKLNPRVEIVQHAEPKQRAVKRQPKKGGVMRDLVMCEPIVWSSAVVLKVPGGYVQFEDHEDAIAYFTYLLGTAQLCMKRSSSKSSVPPLGFCINADDVEFSLDLLCVHTKFGRASEETSIVNSTGPQLVGLFFGGNFPSKPLVHKIQNGTLSLGEKKLCEQFLEFEKKVDKAIQQKIDEQYTNPEFGLVCVRCCRKQLLCGKVCGKVDVVKRGNIDSPPHCCSSCDFEGCPAGCGKPHHGGACDVGVDEASEAFIKSSSMMCPSCGVRSYKDPMLGGCFHMTCTCGQDYCGHCLQKYTMNEVTEHHAVRNEDGSYRCPQFEQRN